MNTPNAERAIDILRDLLESLDDNTPFSIPAFKYAVARARKLVQAIDRQEADEKLAGDPAYASFVSDTTIEPAGSPETPWPNPPF